MNVANPRQGRRSVVNFLQDTCGDAGVEYALLVAVMVSAVFLGAELLQSATTGVFQRACNAINTELAVVAPTNVKAIPPHERFVDSLMDEQLSIFYAQVLTALLAAIVATGLVLRRKSRQTRALHSARSEHPSPAQQEALNVVNSIYEKRQAIFRHLARDSVEHNSSQLTVDKLMTKTVTCVGPTAKSDAVRDLMSSRRIRHVLVCSEDGRLQGIISDRDLQYRDAKTAAQLMTASPVTIEPTSEVLPAVTLLLDRRFSCLPVVEDNKIVGVLTTSDLMMTLQCLLKILQRSIEQPMVRSTTNQASSATHPLAT